MHWLAAAQEAGRQGRGAGGTCACAARLHAAHNVPGDGLVAQAGHQAVQPLHIAVALVQDLRGGEEGERRLGGEVQEAGKQQFERRLAAPSTHHQRVRVRVGQLLQLAPQRGQLVLLVLEQAVEGAGLQAQGQGEQLGRQMAACQRLRWARPVCCGRELVLRAWASCCGGGGASMLTASCAAHHSAPLLLLMRLAAAGGTDRCRRTTAYLIGCASPLLQPSLRAVCRPRGYTHTGPTTTTTNATVRECVRLPRASGCTPHQHPHGQFAGASIPLPFCKATCPLQFDVLVGAFRGQPSNAGPRTRRQCAQQQQGGGRARPLAAAAQLLCASGNAAGRQCSKPRGGSASGMHNPSRCEGVSAVAGRRWAEWWRCSARRRGRAAGEGAAPQLS